MKKFSLAATLLLKFFYSQSQVTAPEIISWIQTPGQTGYSGIASNVQSVNYTASNVYVSCTCIPGYDIGPWAGNPNTPANQNFCFSITRTPVKNNGNLIATPLGHIGVWTNGVSLFNVSDAMSYNNQGVWFRNAYFFEGPSFDDCLGHPQQQGEYHTHVNPTCLYDDQATSVHSPIIGYAFDGFPIYGAYAYSDTAGLGVIKRMTPSYRTRTMSDRTTLPNGSVASSAGPAINGQYPLGAFIQDFEYVPGLGNLDEHNGRFAVTPDYPAGIYAYYVAIDSNQTPIYPYLLGPTFYGTVPAGNTGMQSGHNTIPGNATLYIPTTGFENLSSNRIATYPNPVADFISVDFGTSNSVMHHVDVIDMGGKQVAYISSIDSKVQIAMNEFSSGVYLVRVTDEEGKSFQQKIFKQ